MLSRYRCRTFYGEETQLSSLHLLDEADVTVSAHRKLYTARVLLRDTPGVMSFSTRCCAIARVVGSGRDIFV
jgi:hypothetical protein